MTHAPSTWKKRPTQPKHFFCFGYVQCWPMMRAAFLLFRLSFNCIWQVLPSDDQEEEVRAYFSTCHKRNEARERSQTRSPQHYVLSRFVMSSSIPAWERRPGRRNQALSDVRTAGPSSTTAQHTSVLGFRGTKPPEHRGACVQACGQSTCPHCCAGTASTAHPGLLSAEPNKYIVALHRVFSQVSQSKRSRRTGISSFILPFLYTRAT